MEAETARPPNFMQTVALQKAGKACAGWELYKWELIGDPKTANDFVVGIGQCRLIETGPRKGRKTWKDKSGKLLPNMEVVVTGAEIDAAKARFERDTGWCHCCGGSGQAWARWSAAEGTQYRDCARCGATGKAPT